MEDTSNIPTIEAIIADIEEKMQSDPVIKTWFSKFKSKDHEHFIKEYARNHVDAREHTSRADTQNTSRAKEFNEMAMTCLEAIQIKKMFNLECQWRAGQIEVPLNYISSDFHYWYQDIMECPFLTPIEWEDVELIQAYLKTEEANLEELNELKYDAPHHELIVKSYRNEGNPEHDWVPNWFEYYDTYRGTASLMALPDIRYQAEKPYRQAGDAVLNPPTARTPAPPDPDSGKNYLMSAFDHGAEFAKIYEGSETLEMILDAYEESGNYLENYDLTQAYEYLKTMPGVFPFIEADTWQDSLMLTVEAYEKEQTSIALNRVYKKYIRQIKPDAETWVANRIQQFQFNISNSWYPFMMQLRETFLKGREVMGEPRDFDYDF